MTREELKEIGEAIENEVSLFIDDHPVLCRLHPIARRNMAYMAGDAAISALTKEEIDSLY